MKLKYIEIQNRINEEWSTEAPVGVDWSFLPETVVQTLVPNFLTARPPVGNLTVEDVTEYHEVINSQRCLTDADYKFIEHADSAPYEIFYEWLALRGERPSMKELRDWWEDEERTNIVSKLKDALQRVRPYINFGEIHLAPGIKTSDYSFPSGHACGAYFIATKLSKRYPHLLNGLMNLADRIARSRVQAGVHYPSDIKAGKEIGISLAN